jgi:hypothetical protein
MCRSLQVRQTDFRRMIRQGIRFLEQALANAAPVLPAER